VDTENHFTRSALGVSVDCGVENLFHNGGQNQAGLVTGITTGHVENSSVANNFALRALDGPLMAERDTIGDRRREEEAKLFEQFGDESRAAINTYDARISEHRSYIDQTSSSSHSGTVFGREDTNVSREHVDNAAVVDVTVDIRLKWTHEIHCDSVEWIVGEERSIEDVAGTRDTPSHLTVWT
jgi:hypothetical protein